MSEVARMMMGLRAAGWSEKDINDFVLWVNTGEVQFKPNRRNKELQPCNMAHTAGDRKGCPYGVGCL